jgi:hypothetical protein
MTNIEFSRLFDWNTETLSSLRSRQQLCSTFLAESGGTRPDSSPADPATESRRETGNSGWPA